MRAPGIRSGLGRGARCGAGRKRRAGGLLVTLALAVVPGSYAAEPPLRFNRDIRPILADKCWVCHGPDAKSKNIRLRLDSEAAAKADLGGHKAIVASTAVRL